MKRIFSAIFAALCALAVFALKPAEVENVHLKNRTRFVTDAAGALSPETLTRADSILSGIWQQTSAEPVVVIVPDMSGDDANTFATELFDLWKIGKADKDNGVLVLVSVNDRKAVIRTGYGVEGLLPDVIASNIIRNQMAPNFREGNYDAGILATLQTLQTVMTSDEAREELLSSQKNDALAGNEGEEMWQAYVYFSLFLGIGGLAVVLILFFSSRKLPTAQAYSRLQGLKLPLAVATPLGLFMPLPALLLLLLLLRHVRLHKRLCPHCGTRMERVDEDNDNAYLSQPQDVEEKLNSVDYDVWLCPDCGETDIIPYVNREKNFSVCPQCGARACVLTGRRTLVRPTTRSEGMGVEEHRCLNCNNRTQRRYSIPKKEVPVAPVIIGGGRGGFGGGGGFSGGSFGGGMTGGGGASGGW